MAGSALGFHGQPPAYLTFAALAALGLPNATTTRRCPGVASFDEPISAGRPASPFRADAILTLAGAGLDLARVSYAKQVHGAAAAPAPAGGGFAGPVDILVTVEARTPLAIFTADCLALILYDPAAHALGAAHVGWRGTVHGAAQAAVAALAPLGARPGRLHAAIAPSVGPCCYEVDEPVTRELARAYPEQWEAWAAPGRPGRVMLDLWSANEALLRGAGVDPVRIENPRLCTACHPELFYSYRRGDRGRLATLAALP
jgi:YfiH family protein